MVTDRVANGLTSEAVITVHIEEANDPPTAAADSFTVAEDSIAVALDVLANDSIEPDDGETLTILRDRDCYGDPGKRSTDRDGRHVHLHEGHGAARDRCPRQ
jgi:hypothetical protein